MRDSFYFFPLLFAILSVDLLEGLVIYCNGFGGIHYIMYTCIREQLGTFVSETGYIG